jgi:hypothetical protein
LNIDELAESRELGLHACADVNSNISGFLADWNTGYRTRQAANDAGYFIGSSSTSMAMATMEDRYSCGMSAGCATHGRQRWSATDGVDRPAHLDEKSSIDESACKSEENLDDD